MRLLFAFLIAISPSLAQAQIVKLVRQECGLLRCQQGYGSGVVVGRQTNQSGGTRYYVLTVAHMAGDQKQRLLVRRGHDCKLFMHAASGQWPTRVESINVDAMLMLLTCEVSAGVPAVPFLPVANRLPQAGEPVVIHGYSRYRNGQYGSRSLVLRSVSEDIFTTNSPFQEGESGGPVLDSNGQIVGLCEGYYVHQRNVGLGPSIVAIRRFLLLPDIGSSPGLGSQGGGGAEGTVPMRPGVPVPPPPVPSDTATPGSGGVSVPGGMQPSTVVSPPVPGPSAVPNPAPQAPAPVAIQSGTPASDTGAPESPQTGNAGASSNKLEKGVAAVKTGLDIFSLLVGGGATGGAGLAIMAGLKILSSIRARKQSLQQPQGQLYQQYQPPPQQHATVQQPPVVAGIPPHNVNWVQVPVDPRKNAVDYALAESVRMYPGIQGTASLFQSLINTHLQSSGMSSDELHRVFD